MFWERRKRAGSAFWMLAAGTVAAVAATIWLVRRDRRAAGAPRKRRVRQVERAVVAALRDDEVLRARGIDIAAVGQGIIEMTGRVETEEEARHAVELVQSVPGVRTVVNRLDLSEFEQRLSAGRRARMEGGSRWYGMGVGMGRRRQSPATDPARRDDHADMLADALSADLDDLEADQFDGGIQQDADTRS